MVLECALCLFSSGSSAGRKELRRGDIRAASLIVSEAFASETNLDEFLVFEFCRNDFP